MLLRSLRMFLSSWIALWVITSYLVTAQIDQCVNECANYNSILDGCQHDADVYSAYKSCVCNDGNFQTYVQQCIACEGPNSNPATFQQNCKDVPPDCTVACSSFGLIISSCGDTSAPGYEDCVCGSAYDTTYTTTFNQAFTDCVNCATNGGIAAEWEARCCASKRGCNGMSPEASAAAATIKPTTTSPSQASNTLLATVSTSSGSALNSKDIHALGTRWTHVLTAFLFELFWI
jgi:hypothetical protein